MNDKRELGLAVIPTIEWCARYGNVGRDEKDANWEVYVQNRLVAYNYDNDNCYITKYTSTGWFPKNLKLNVRYDYEKLLFSITKNHV